MNMTQTEHTRVQVLVNTLVETIGNKSEAKVQQDYVCSEVWTFKQFLQNVSNFPSKLFIYFL